MTSVDAMVAAIKTRDAERARALLAEDPALVNAKTASGDSMLLLAIYHHAGHVVEALRKHGAVSNLWEAAALGDEARVRTLLEADPTLARARSHDGWTPLHLAAHFGHPAVTRQLLARGAELDARSTNGLGNTPLQAAASGGKHGCVEVLLAHGADVHGTYLSGITALHAAAAAGDDASVRALLERGAAPQAITADGKTPLDLARDRGHAHVARRLEVALASPDAAP